MFLYAFILFPLISDAFLSCKRIAAFRQYSNVAATSAADHQPGEVAETGHFPISSRDKLQKNLFATGNAIKLIFPTILIGMQASQVKATVFENKFEYQPALQGLDYGKPRTLYPDYLHMPSGLQYKIVKDGSGVYSAQAGDRVVIDWEGYTIGYYGRPFQTRNKVKGGAFDTSEKEYFRWVVGSGNAVAALDEVVKYLSEGTVAQVIVPAELGYPAKGDSDHDIVGPKPSTFSGIRALNFVLDNKNLIDKTLLINVKLVRVDKKGTYKS